MPGAPPFQIRSALGPSDMAEVARLFRSYAASLSVDLAYQDFETELAHLPGKYAPPCGALFLALDDLSRAVGCVGLRELGDPGAVELKRLYVSPIARGMGLGLALVATAVGEAQRLGYREIKLDTLADMKHAQALYMRYGFEYIPAYYDTPIAGTVFMRLDLASPTP